MPVSKVFSSQDFLNDSPNGAQIALGTISGPASYAAGGFDADIETDLALDGAPTAVFVNASNGYPAVWNSSTKKILAYGNSNGATLAETANAADLSAVTFTLLAIRKLA